MSDSIIDIKSEDVLENLENLLQKRNVFKTHDNIYHINLTIFYLEDNSVVSYQKRYLDIKNNRITKTELMKLILDNNKYHSKNYDLTGIYKFEVNLQENEIRSYCNSPENHSFLKKYSNIQDVTFSPCIKILENLNYVFFFFTKKQDVNTIENEKKTNDANSTNDANNTNENKNRTRKKVKFEDSEKIIGNKHHTKTCKKYT